ncbi:unnamed protein product [Adineta steineri]|uniref:Alpha/beta hydrolase fold-3 domain-containing protein n=1 Tax=Adineta steineri TaxID=433720 RepID=A0A816BM41_9BILA|nr:unnamed protein product [Adineta steineri]CAF1611948.1 unnamed protein product [Adineta steineri]
MTLFQNGLFGCLKKLTIIILIVAIAIPLRYGSTSPSYLAVRLIHSMFSLKNSLIPDKTRPTLSADYRAFEDLIRMKPLTKIDTSADPLVIIKELRLTMGQTNISPKPAECQIRKEIFKYNAQTTDGYWVSNQLKSSSKNSDKILIYIHGGGFMTGDINTYSGFECYLSRIFNINVLHVEYRLVPEHPYPAAVDDTIALYHALLDQNISSSRMMIMGDSAGGGLTLQTMQVLITRELPVPHGVILLSPWADISSSGESYTRNRPIDPILFDHNSTWVAAQILGPKQIHLSHKDPLISPLYGSFKGFPPMYVNVGTAEITEDDSREIVKRAKQANVDVTLEVAVHLMHVYPIFYLYYPEARNTIDNINEWMKTKFD